MDEHVRDQAEFLDTKLKPKLDAAQAGQGHVFFVDAAHFVFGTFLCCLWSFTRIYVRAASGRQRFNVLGAWNAVTRELIAVTNTTVVNTETMCELLRKIANLGLTGPITLVLDNARYQRNAVVQALAAQLGLSLLFLPSYSPNLNLIETTVEVHEASRPVRSLPPDLQRLSSRHPRGSRRLVNQVRRGTGLADDAQFPAIRGRLTHGRVRYRYGVPGNSDPARSQAVILIWPRPITVPLPMWIHAAAARRERKGAGTDGKGERAGDTA